MQQVVIKPLAKGQITIPISFRKTLGIDKSTLFKAQLKKDGILLTPLQFDWQEKYIREFTDDEIKEWLREDRLDKKELKKIKQYLK
ncbi:MAG: AbrB/MazE/SpoVT family DNA-binding domain-containing protein [Patescibacteria group bacterium]